MSSPSAADVVRGYLDTEIIVASEHAALVARLIGVDRVPGPNELLGLTRFELPDPHRNLEALNAHLAAEKVPPGDIAKIGAAPRDDVERILRGVRAYCAATYMNWVPTIGKSRTLDHVTFGTGAISHGGGGRPTPVRRSGALGLASQGAISHGGGGGPRSAASAHPVSRASGPGHDVRVGVVDTKLFPVPYLDGGWVGGYTDTFAADAVTPYRGGHATFVSGLVLSQAPGATVDLEPVLNETEASASAWDVAEAIVRLGRSGVDVMNLSLVGYTEDGGSPLLLSAAIDRLDPDVVVVAAAGNHGDAEGTAKMSPGWPAALDDVVAVGAVDRWGAKASFSPDVPWIDIYALGVNVVSCFPGKVYDDRDQLIRFNSGLARWSGTSFAAAQVSGAIAAGVVPGRVTAREALSDLLRSCSTIPATVPPAGLEHRLLQLRRLPPR